MSDFDYGKAEADLDDIGCRNPEEVYGYKSEKGFNEFMRENGLNPDRYRTGGNSGSSGNNGGCYLTTACTVARDLPDDCFELQTLRNFRDTYLAAQNEGKDEIAFYYQIAARIVESINSLSNSKQIWENLYEELILPCIKHIGLGEFASAHKRYRQFTLDLAKKHCSGELADETIRNI